MSDVNPVAYIAETLRAIFDGHPRSRIEDLMPWHFRKASSLAAEGLGLALIDEVADGSPQGVDRSL